LRALAITSAQRSPLLPDVPTIAESGFPSFDVQSWFGLAAPAGTPKPIVNRLNAELVKILGMEDVQQRLTQMGASRAPGTPTEMGKFMAAEVDRWREVVKASGAKAG
jgi:tripartite-type tricarboxylate transporter receptor subunit TctC